MKIISVPDLSFTSSIEFCHDISLDNLSSDCVFDFSSTRNFDPFPMLIVSSTLRRIRKEHPDFNWSIRNCDKSYPQHMGFFQSFGGKIGKKPGEAKGNENYLPIEKMQVNDLREESRSKNIYIGETIENESGRMALVLARGNSELKKSLVFILTEMIRNIPEHSGADEIWYCAQYWPMHDLVELAILDEGCGIRNSLCSNATYQNIIKSDEMALNWATKPGISRTFSPFSVPKQGHDYWENSGYGLFMVSRVCSRLGGGFIIASGDSALQIKYSNGNYQYDMHSTSFPGTAIQMRIKPSMIDNYGKIINEVLKEGTMQAKDEKYAFKTASKSSRG